VIDLHMHSTCSDGTDSPEELARLVVASGVSAAALTDHDTMAGSAAFAEALRAAGVEPVPGVEISCLDASSGRSAHLLCYFLEDPEAPLAAVLATLREDRATRNARLLEKLAEEGCPVDADRVEELAGKPLEAAGRPHFAQAVLEAHPAQFADLGAVFAELLGESGRAYVPKARVSIAEATDLARASGAVTVLAHPLQTFAGWVDGVPRSFEEERRLLDAAFAQAADWGVSGAEAYYSRHTPEQVAMVRELCEAHGLVATGGSDFHGQLKPDLCVGHGIRSKRGTPAELHVPDSALDELKARRPIG
jgi:3',5'-nucleoside bisphosphate phosphatase